MICDQLIATKPDFNMIFDAVIELALIVFFKMTSGTTNSDNNILWAPNAMDFNKTTMQVFNVYLRETVV